MNDRVTRARRQRAKQRPETIVPTPERRNLRVEVERFGPVASGEIELKPLTILIGANNSGKTYLAQLLYVLSKVLSARAQDPFSHSRQMSFVQYLHEMFEERTRDIPLDELPNSIQTQLIDDMNSYTVALELYLEDALRDYFGVGTISELAQTSRREAGLRIVIHGSGSRSPLAVIASAHDQESVELERPTLASIRVPVDALETLTEPLDGLLNRFVIERAWLDLASEHGIPEQAEFYLPSARSGILAAWPLVTSIAIGVVRRRLGPEPIEVGALSGVAGDFLQILVANFLSGTRPRQRIPVELLRVLQVLEGQILKGQVSVEDSGKDGSRLLYRTRELRLPVQRASSMVAELAPLDLWIRQLLAPGDLLIIDEPEAHLHPQNQRNMARVLARLANAGVRIVCPTHSSLIVHQLSNHILAGDATEEERKALGFTEDDVLDASQVGVYLFDVQDDGTHIREVPIIEGFGISEEEFASVAEQIGDETFRLATSAARALEATA